LDGTTIGRNGGNGRVVNSTSFQDTIGATSTVAAHTVVSLASNVISANSGNGIVIPGSPDNQLIANYIGTDVNGSLVRGNGGNGVLLDQGAHNNTIGGTIPFINSSHLVPLSNLISGNQAMVCS
jgi:hypothetical protein